MKLYLNYTLVIPTFKRHRVINKTINSIFLSNYLPKKIFIIDQNYDSLTEKNIKNIFRIYNYSNYIIIKNLLNKGLTNSKNIILKKIDTPFVAFLDDDIILSKNYYFYLINLLTKKKALGASGVISNLDTEYFKNLFHFLFSYGIFKDNRKYYLNKKKIVKETHYIAGGISIYRKDIFKKNKFETKYAFHNYEDVSFCNSVKKNNNKAKFLVSNYTSAFEQKTKFTLSFERKNYFKLMLLIKFFSVKNILLYLLQTIPELIFKLITVDISFYKNFYMNLVFIKKKLKII